MGNKSKASYKWVVLTTFTAVAGVSQLLWLNFAPLITQLMDKYNKDELTVSLLILVFPLLYVLLSIPSGAMIDKRGYKFTVGFGSILMAVFSVLRIFDSNFYILLIAQTGIAIGQPFVVNGISKLVADWFPKEENGLATGLGTVGMFIGMALGMGLTPILVEGHDIRQAMIVFAVISVVSALAFLIFAKENNKNVTSSGERNAIKEFRALLKQKDLVLLFIICFLALGYFNGLTSWIEPMLGNNGFDAEQAGLAGAMLILGGIVGAIVIPALSDKFKNRKLFLIGSCLIGLVITYPFCMHTDYNSVLIMGAILGFFFLPGYALLLTMSEELAGIERAGAATGMLMLFGNAGGTIVIVAMQLVKGDSTSWLNAIYLMLALLFLSLVIALFVKETFSKEEELV